jgi:hypothetical protein
MGTLRLRITKRLHTTNSPASLLTSDRSLDSHDDYRWKCSTQARQPFLFLISPFVLFFKRGAPFNCTRNIFYILQCYRTVLGDGYTAQRLEVSDAGTLTTSCATSMNASQDIGRICMVMIQEMYQKLAARVSAAYSTLEHLACII